jgi:hypothetical protein
MIAEMRRLRSTRQSLFNIRSRPDPFASGRLEQVRQQLSAVVELEYSTG